MTLAQLGKIVGLSEATVQRYESGNIKNPPMMRIEALANALDVPAAILLGMNDEKLDAEIRLLLSDVQNLPVKRKTRVLMMLRLAVDFVKDV